MLQFSFMRRALLAGFLLSMVISSIGVIMVNRKTSMVADAISHTSLTGVGLGLIFGFDPIFGAVGVCVVAAFSIEGIRRRFPNQGDMSTAVIMSMGLGIAATLAGFAPGGNTFESYLFGSISSVTREDMLYIIALTIPVLLCCFIYYGGYLSIGVDKTLARINGVKVKLIDFYFTLLSAVAIAVSCKIVGALMVSSLIVLPVMTSLIFAKSYKSTYISSVVLSVIYTLLGITASYYMDINPGGMIVINACVGIILFTFINFLRNKKLEKIKK